MEDSLKKRYFIKLLSNVINALIGIVIIAIVPNALGTIAYGQFVYIQDFFMKIIGFLDMGSSIAFFTKLSARNDRKELITFYFIYSLILLIFTFTFIILIDLYKYTEYFLPNIPNNYIYMGLFLGFSTWLTQIFIKISDAYALTVSVELIKILHKILSLFLVLFFVYQSVFGIKQYFYFHYITLITFLLILTWVFVKKGIFGKGILNLSFGFKTIAKEFIEYCHPLLFYGIIGILTGLFDIWLLQKIAGSEQTGFYGLAYSIIIASFLFTSAMIPIIMREFSKSHEENNINLMRSNFNRYIPMLYSLSAFFGIFLAFQSENFLAIFTDEKFKDVYWVLVVMAFYPLYQTYGQLSGSIFYATGQTKLYRNIGIASMLIGVFFTWLFIYFLELGAFGLAIKTLLVAIISVNIQLYFNAKLLNLKMNYFVWHQIYSIVFFATIANISVYLVHLYTNPLLNLTFSSLIYLFLVSIATYMFPQVFATTRSEITTIFTKAINVIKK